jgi:two-component system chemotaxis response regulator CheV
MEKVLGDLNPNLAMRLEPDQLNADRPAKDCLKALIADDSASIRRMIATMLEKSGFQVTQTTNGREAWDLLAAHKGHAAEEQRPLYDYVDVVVSDIEMPVMDGHNLTKRIKDDPVLKELPVILFSSLITDRLRHKGESVGADDQVSKPDITTLTNRAYELIEARQGPLGLGKKAC